MEERLVEVEIRLEHQERALHEISDVLAEQGRRLDAMQREIERLAERLKALTEAGD